MRKSLKKGESHSPLFSSEEDKKNILTLLLRGVKNMIKGTVSLLIKVLPRVMKLTEEAISLSSFLE
jgi:hypothetical protein